MIKWLNMQDKKIIQIITKGSPFGGAQKYVCDIALFLNSQKIKNEVIVGNGDELPKILKENGVEVIEIKEMIRNINPFKEISALVKIIKVLKKEKPDVLHLSSSKAGFIGALAGRICGVPKIIFTAHGFAFNEKLNWFYKIAIYKMSCLTAILCHKIIVINRKEFFQTSRMPFVDNKKIILIHNGIEKIDFLEKENVKSFFEGKIGKKFENDFILGTIAELHRNKGLDILINSLAKINLPFTALIIGEGMERENLESLIKEKKLEEKVFLLGKIEKASKYLKAFDGFILPSRKEGLPYTLLEAGEAKLACIGSSVGGIPEILDDGAGILIKPENTEEIISAISKIISSPEDAQKMAGKLNQKIERNFSLEKMLQKTFEIYFE